VHDVKGNRQTRKTLVAASANSEHRCSSRVLSYCTKSSEKCSFKSKLSISTSKLDHLHVLPGVSRPMPLSISREPLSTRPMPNSFISTRLIQTLNASTEQNFCKVDASRDSTSSNIAAPAESNLTSPKLRKSYLESKLSISTSKLHHLHLHPGLSRPMSLFYSQSRETLRTWLRPSPI
jgi:hypothetical protein